MTHTLRVGIVDFLNSRPLAWDFLHGEAPPNLRASFHPPAEVADRLRDRELDIGLVPSIEMQRISELLVLDGACIAAQEEVRSVLLVSKVPAAEIRRVAIDENSRTSVALLRILLAENYGVEPELMSLRPHLDEMLAVADAALVIGDPALKVEVGSMNVLDLAREWRDLTGMPFVFAVWAVRRDVVRPGLAKTFRSSRDHGLTQLPVIAEEASVRLGLNPDEVLHYLSRNLSYELGAAERRSLVEFFSRAAALGLVRDVRPLEYVL
ncbi:MAG: menaquinone biosynthesis protein [Acidobacteriota bacterium]|nr:menaquinone biosynthesis protein [Acidobacteriota bacterium]